MILVKLKNGFYSPAYPSDHDKSGKVAIGEEVRAVKSRHLAFHRKGFALLNLGFSNQDKFDSFEIYRSVITMKAGFVDWIPGTDGKAHPIPQSLSFDKMNAEKFEQWYEAIGKVIQADCQLSGKEIESEIINFY